jgi:hypothetical protein
MYVIAILFFLISGLTILGGTIAWIGTLFELVMAVTSMQAFGIMCGGAVMAVLSIIMFFIFSPKMKDVGGVMGDMLDGMMESQGALHKRSLKNRNFP